MKEMYGYIRVSTKDQCEERQIIAMHEFGVSDRDIYMDKLSGKTLSGRSTNGCCADSIPGM